MGAWARCSTDGPLRRETGGRLRDADRPPVAGLRVAAPAPVARSCWPVCRSGRACSASGCGAGGELAELAGLRPGWRFVAADLSADMLALARQRCARLGLLERIELHCGDVAGLPPAPPCDAALVLLVLHFLRGDQAAGASSRRSPSVWRQRHRCCWPT
ncbi:class I SAM-dependent methyltransferase [Pseudomonas aeruginosa]|nr:class I SAM-dependent methyltransferase [Pseudomonas aeruginosa]